MSMRVTIEESMEWEKNHLLTKQGHRKNSQRVYLTHKQKGNTSLYAYIHECFDVILTTYDALKKLAIERFGNEGWRRVSFEGIGLCFAYSDGWLLKKEKE